jgi:hypothetical protein
MEKLHFRWTNFWGQIMQLRVKASGNEVRVDLAADESQAPRLGLPFAAAAPHNAKTSRRFCSQVGFLMATSRRQRDGFGYNVTARANCSRAVTQICPS